jgi:uncharacterized protein
MSITASMLYDLVHCPHRVALDLYGDPAERDSVTAFVELLWEKGHAFETQVIENLRTPVLDLTEYRGPEREARTIGAMRRGDHLIYGGRISAGDLVGEPDLLRRFGTGYVAGDIKSGAGTEGASEDSDGRPKPHYAVQLALYTDILERLERSASRRPFVWDIHGDEAVYDLMAPQGIRNPRTLWDIYESCLATARAIERRSKHTLPALAGSCKLCHWRTHCTRQLEGLDDLTLIPELGRAKRDTMVGHIATVHDLAAADRSLFTRGTKSVFPGIGLDTLDRFQERARLQVTPGARPYLTLPLGFPAFERELFFDVETDPFRDICYLHGFVERQGGDSGTEQYVPFFSERPTSTDEGRAFADAWSFVRARESHAIYYYSPYERTAWLKLQRRFPDVASEAEVQALFSRPTTIDLYRVVHSQSVWPTRNFSIKTLATAIGFKWRDTEPSGAASIEWYHRWVESHDAVIRQRILDYNEDDCAAMGALLDELRTLRVDSR